MNKTLKKIAIIIALPVIAPIIVGTMWLASKADHKELEKKNEEKEKGLQALFFYCIKNCTKYITITIAIMPLTIGVENLLLVSK